jgi:ribosomal protein L12E/L44/L45/RPP1/RPP2
MRISRLVNADSALGTFAWAPAQDLRRSSRETAAAAGTAESKGEHTQDAEEEETEDRFAK